MGRCVYQPLESVMKHERNPGSSYGVTSVLLRACHYLWTSYLRISNRAGYKFPGMRTPYCTSLIDSSCFENISIIVFRSSQIGLILACNHVNSSVRYFHFSNSQSRGNNHIWSDRERSADLSKQFQVSYFLSPWKSIGKSLRRRVGACLLDANTENITGETIVPEDWFE